MCNREREIFYKGTELSQVSQGQKWGCWTYMTPETSHEYTIRTTGVPETALPAHQSQLLNLGIL